MMGRAGEGCQYQQGSVRRGLGHTSGYSVLLSLDGVEKVSEH